MNPIPCINCGRMFMRQSPKDIDVKHCNNCKKKDPTPLDMFEINIQLPRQKAIEVEDKCITEGISFSSYFTMLHDMNMPTQKINMNESKEEETPKKNKSKKY